MTRYAVARLEEIEELTDGRAPLRPVRNHFGITSFGVNAWTARQVGDRIINEHDESDPDSDEELYLVLRGRAMFELDGDRVAVTCSPAVLTVQAAGIRWVGPPSFQVAATSRGVR